MVQINVEVKSHPGSKPRLNIVDILKPAEEVADLAPSPGNYYLTIDIMCFLVQDICSLVRCYAFPKALTKLVLVHTFQPLPQQL